MAAYAPQYTGRYKVKYRVLGRPHSMTLRTSRSALSPTGVRSLFDDLFNALSSRLFTDFTVVGADFAAPDSEIFLPVSPIPIAASTSGIAGDSSHTPQYASFVGRTMSGGPVRLFIYGWSIAPQAADNTANDWRVTAAEDTAVADAVDVLNGATGAGYEIVGNDNASVVWYPYVNVGQNAHEQRKARRG